MRSHTLLLITLLSAAALAEEQSTDGAQNFEGAVIGKIRLEKSNVFDLSIPEENNRLYRFANRLHILTQDKVIQKQLLFRSGDKYSARKIDESERILRQNLYLFDASITPERRKDATRRWRLHRTGDDAE